jgi:hypothetical protein
MEESPWETDSRSIFQYITRILWNANIYYHVYNTQLIIKFFIYLLIQQPSGHLQIQ